MRIKVPKELWIAFLLVSPMLAALLVAWALGFLSK
jgi:hypothetical protein